MVVCCLGCDETHSKTGGTGDDALGGGLAIYEWLDSLEGRKAEAEDVTARLELKDKGFEAFYGRFISDPAYQVAHLRFPMEGGYSGHDDEREWMPKDWPVMRWDMRDVSLKETPDDTIVLEEKGDTVSYGLYCGGCGFSLEIRFEKLDGEWWLVYRQENNF